MAFILAVPVLGVALMLQMAIASRIPLLSGTVDLLLVILAAWSLQERVKTAWLWAVLGGLMVAVVSGLPWYIPIISYLLVVGAGRLLTRRVWQAPLLAMFIVTFMGSLVLLIISLVVLGIRGDPLPVGESFSLVILPSILLNLIVAIPSYWLMRDLAGRLYPGEVEV